MELYMESEDISESEFEELSQSQPQASSGSDYIPEQESDQGSESLDSQVHNSDDDSGQGGRAKTPVLSFRVIYQ